MKLIKKNLSTVKNKLLLELEDLLVDLMLEQMNSEDDSDENKAKVAKEAMMGIMRTVRNDATKFAIICYTDEDGKHLTEECLKEIPLKIKIIQDALPDIIEIVMETLNEGMEDEGKPQQKPKRVTRKK